MFQLINGNTEYRVRRDPDSPVLSGEVRIPAYYRRPETGEYLPVKEIGATTDVSTGGAFYNTRITVIYIPETVTVIGNYAFAISAGSTSYLTTVNIEEDSRLQRIGNYAFSDCNNLTGITIPAGVNTIGNYAFYNCASLTGITIPEGVTAISQYAFSGCTSLTGIIIHEGITSIGGNAFSGCTSLTSVTIGENVTTIGSNAFSGCSSLTEITIPANVTSISSGSSGAFSSCTNLTDIIIDNDKVTGNWGDRFPADNLSVTFKKNIGITAFYNCTRLTGVTIEENVAAIGSNAFIGCTGLTDIIIDTDKITINQTQTSNWGTIFPDGRYSITFKKNIGIGNYAFYNCISLTGISIPAGVTSIGQEAFRGCRNLTTVTFAPDSQLRNIGYLAFYYCESLTSITIPAGVTFIPNGLHQSQQYPVYGVFAYCTSLETVTFANGSQLEDIGSYAFYSCTGLTSITIPAGVTSIGSDAFYGCTSLTGITVDANNLNYASQDGILYNKAKTAFIHIPKAISGNVTIPEGVTYIGDFYYCTSLTSITFAAGSQLQTIGDYAFDYCTSLTGITIPAGVTIIGQYAFRDCTSLTSITIPASVTSIGTQAFKYWTDSQTINVPFANAGAKPSGWYSSWNYDCSAIIRYWNGSSYQ